MRAREELMEIIRKELAQGCRESICNHCDLYYLDYPRCRATYMADRIIEEGVIVPPVKIGQTVYPLRADPRFRAFVERIEQTTNGLYFEWVQYDVGVDCTETWDAEGFGIEDIGKTVFLDETEYLKALAEERK